MYSTPKINIELLSKQNPSIRLISNKEFKRIIYMDDITDKTRKDFYHYKQKYKFKVYCTFKYE